MHHNLENRRRRLVVSLMVSFFVASAMSACVMEDGEALDEIGSTQLAVTNDSTDVNIVGHTCKGIVGMFTGHIPNTYPWDQAYGPKNFWSQWDIVANSDGSVSFHVGGYYIRAGINDSEVNSQTYIGPWEKFTLEELNGSYYIKTWRNTYLKCQGDWNTLVQVSSKEDAARWYFFNLAVVN